MIQTRQISKSQRIVEALKEAIDSGELRPGSRLEGMRDIGRKFEASLSVVNHAFDILERQGHIVRRRRSGVFVREQKIQADPWRSCVLVCMPPDGHLYGALYRSIQQQLNLHGLSAVTIRSDMVLVKPPSEALARHIGELLRTNLAGAIVMGLDYWKNPFLAGFPQQKSVFVLELDYPDICGHGVLIDYEAAYHAISTHLIETGKRRIAFMVPPEAMRTGQRRMLHFDQMCNGYERALREHDLAGSCRYLTELDTSDTGSIQALIADLFAEKRAPDAIMCYQDVIAVRLIHAAAKLGIAVPEELAVTGFYHTPWVNFGPLTVTSARIDVDTMAKHAIKLVLSQPESPQMIYMNPELCIGTSSAPIATKQEENK